MTMNQVIPGAAQIALEIRELKSPSIPARLAEWEALLQRQGPFPLTAHPAWVLVLAKSLGQVPYALEAQEAGKLRGFLPLSYLKSHLFGRFLVSTPYVNYGGVTADDPMAATLLIDHALKLADRLDVQFLELRHTQAIAHDQLTHHPAHKVHMRLDLPPTPATLWDALDPKVRNQVRKGQKNGLHVEWGGTELLDHFYSIFSRNMRDLGTPVYPARLFHEAFLHFPGRIEICLVRADKVPVAAAFLTHGWGVTEVPSASSLREYNSTCANMLMYWNLLERAIQRGHNSFDFGRSTPDGPVYRFKKQWGASPTPAEWQVYRRSGSGAEMRPDNPRYRRAIDLWKKLPVPVTRWLGPLIVRGIP